MLMCLAQVFATQGAVDAHFALGPAADGTDIAPHPGAESPRSASVADGAGHFLSIKVNGSQSRMSRSNLFFKVEVEHDSDENPQRIGDEIRRHLKKLYGVLDVELSNVTTDED